MKDEIDDIEAAEAGALEHRAAALERRLAELEASTTLRLIRAELKAEAVRAGMVDLDGLKLVDLAGLKLSDSGEVDGAEAVMRNLQRVKPWLFGKASSSSAATVPPAQPSAPKKATEMSHEEWLAARREMLRRR
jgi:hypothetical protein